MPTTSPSPIYEESPSGPLANQILGGEPVLACNWGFGIESGKPYFDTGMATRGQGAHLELAGPGRIAIVSPPRPLFGLLGRPLGANPAARGRVGMVGLPRGAPSFAERPRALTRDQKALPAAPVGFAERHRSLTRDREPLPSNPVAHVKSQAAVPPNPPARGLGGRTGLPANPRRPFHRAHLQELRRKAARRG